MKHQTQLLVSATGSGKTWIGGAILNRLIESQYCKNKTCSPWPIVWITKANIVEKTKRDLLSQFGLTSRDVLVINADQLRSKFGGLYVERKIEVFDGEELIKWIWRPHLYPIVVVLDECQLAKNERTSQSLIIQALSEINDPNLIMLWMSATPGMKVNDFKAFVLNCRLRVAYNDFTKLMREDQFGGVLITDKNWNQFAKAIAYPAEPDEYAPAATQRLMDFLTPYIVRVKGIKPQFHARNSVRMITFETEEGRKFYELAIERFLEKKNKAENAEGLTAAQINIAIIVALLQYRIAAESNPDRVRFIARSMVEHVQKGYAAIAAVNFKVSVIKLVQCLHDEFGISRDQISLIWGGGSTEPTKKQKAKAVIETNENVIEALRKAGITLKDLNMEDVEAKLEAEELPPELRLGVQSREERQREIDKFQRGKTLYCIYTFKSGGIGLSLHHSDDYTKEKCRRKKSGYVFTEDIKNIPTRPRVTFVAPTWSGIEMVQGLGRAPRLTSLSDTYQYLIFFAGTVEERVARRVGMALRCLTKVVQQRESWEGMIVGHYSDDQVERKQLTDTKLATDTDDEDDESPDMGFIEEEDEDNENTKS